MYQKKTKAELQETIDRSRTEQRQAIIAIMKNMVADIESHKGVEGKGDWAQIEIQSSNIKEPDMIGYLDERRMK